MGIPGADSRFFVAVGVVLSSRVDETGHWADVSLKPSEAEVFARVAPPHPGCYFPLPDGAEVAVVFPLDGQPVVVGRLWSRVAEPPAEAVAEPDAIWVVNSEVRVKADRVTVEAGLIEHGARGLGVSDGVVHGTGIDPFTGLTYTALGSVSDVVRAEK